MPKNPEIKLMRIPIKDIKCQDCKKDLPFGTYGHYLIGTSLAICTDCGSSKHGWTDKERVANIVKVRELKEDIKALRKLRTQEADALYLIQEKVDIHRFAERFNDLDRLIHQSLDTVQTYMDKVATDQEKAAFLEMYATIKTTQETRKVIQEELEARLFLLERSERKKKHIHKLIELDEEETEQETEETAIAMAQHE